MSVVTTTAEKAVSLLKALKADFKIILPTGEEYGDLEVARPKKRNNLMPIYVHLIEGMSVGDVNVIHAPEGVSVSNLRGAIAGYAFHRWGKGSARTCIVNNTVEILRVQ